MPLSISMVIVLVTTSVMTAVSQMLFKQSATAVTTGATSATNAHKFLELLMIPSFLFALFLYSAAFVLWMWLLSKSTLSILYPIGLSLNVILALVAAHYFLNESITALQLTGIAFVIVGIFIIAR